MMPLKAVLTRVIVTAGIILTAGMAPAEDKAPPPAPARYAVELIVFRNLDQGRNTPEIPAAGSLIADSPLTLIPDDPGGTFMSSLNLGIGGEFDLAPIEESAAQTLSNQPEEPIEQQAGFFIMSPRAEYPDFVPIGKESMTLGKIYERLETLDAYEPIMHLGWIQTGKGATTAMPYRLKGKPRQGDTVTGTITLYKERYLHLALELSLDENRTDPEFYTREIIADMRTTGRMIHKLQESRRVREPSSHYFDHPLFGVIARIEKVETPSPDKGPDSG
jgi:hypothetical protein